VSVYRHISAERAHGAKVSLMCRLLGVSESGYHAWMRRAPSDRALSDAWLLEKIKEIHADNRQVYGSPRIHAELRLAHDVRVGRKRVERLMRQAGISGLVNKKRGKTTIRVPGVRVADDLVERQFTPPAPNVLWIADVTYLRTWEGWLYLAAVQDAYSRRIVGWQMADHMQAELVVDALKMAITRRRPAPGLIHHSDQGSQGEFNWSSQHLDHGGVWWGDQRSRCRRRRLELVGSGPLIGRCVRRCARRAGQSHRGRCNESSGV
jgi:putative transposase